MPIVLASVVRLLGLLGGALLLVGVASTAPSGIGVHSSEANVRNGARATSRVAQARLSFVSRRDGNAEVYVINADGSGQRNLTRNAKWDQCPAWSPDGGRIAFLRSIGGVSLPSIYVMNSDGSGQRKLTRGRAPENCPVWSPDGRQLAYHVLMRNGQTDIFVTNADGSGRRRLTTHPADDHYPRWSPDGHQIAFASERLGLNQVFVMRADGSAERALPALEDGIVDSSIEWSPDGRKLFFESDAVGIFVVNSRGGGLRSLTTLPPSLIADDLVGLSPNGKRILFGRSRQLWVMNADGTGQRRLTQLTQNVGAAAWSSDGRRIGLSLFNAARTTQFDTYVMNANGGVLRLLVSDALLANWAPRP